MGLIEFNLSDFTTSIVYIYFRRGGRDKMCQLIAAWFHPQLIVTYLVF